MSFLIKIIDNTNNFFYTNHISFRKGDYNLELFILDEVVIPPYETIWVDFGIQCQHISLNFCFWQWFKKGFYKNNSYLIIPTSNITKTPLIVKNSMCLINSNYIGNIKVPFTNLSSELYHLKRGQKLVQLVTKNFSVVKYKIQNN